ncbi:MAG TPA: alcohol dehydrogenase catalytic domain-containing protein [Candidatus Polarisedimenticolia bacterium]|jgi:alcohol dehydrogenase
MRSIVLEGPDRISVRDLPALEPGPGEALIDVRLAGICGTDLQLARGYLDFRGVPGHEFVGTVAGVRSPSDRVLLGARVVGEINLGCQTCRLCPEGMERHCPRRRVLGILGKAGAFAEQVTLPISNLRVVPPSLSDEQAAFVEPTAAACEILDQVQVGPSLRTLVLGDGRLALLAAQVLAWSKATVTVAGHHAAKLETARSLGLTAVRSPDEIPRDPFDLVVEATGSPAGLDLALRMVRPRGTVVMKSTCAGRTSFDAWRAVVDEVTLVGSRCGRFEPAIEALSSGEIRVDPLISRILPLDEGPEAFRLAGDGETIKILLRVSG